MNSPANPIDDNDLPMNNEDMDQDIDDQIQPNNSQLNQANDNEEQLSQLVNLEPTSYASQSIENSQINHSEEEKINNITKSIDNDDIEMEDNQLSQLVSLQPIDPSQQQHEAMLEDSNSESEMEDNNQVQQLVNLEINHEEENDEEDDEEVNELNYNQQIKTEHNQESDNDAEFVNLDENSSSIEDLKPQSTKNKNDDEEFVNLDENTEPLSSSSNKQDEEFVNLDESAEILDLDRNTVTYNLEHTTTTTTIDVDETTEILDLDRNTITYNLEHTHSTINLDQDDENYNLNQNSTFISLNPSTSTAGRQPDEDEEEDVKPNLELLTLQQKIAYLEEPMSDEEDVKPNIEELNLAFNINHLDDLDINQSSQDSKPQKLSKPSKPKVLPPEPINNAQVIQIIENDQVVQVINMDEVVTTTTSTTVNDVPNDKVIQVINVEQVIENNQVVHVLNMDESLSTDSDQPIENNPPNQPIVINIPAISSQSSQPKSPSPSQSSQSNSGGALKRKNITEKQKHLIEFLHLENGLTAEQIRNHDKLRREDGSRILLKTIKYWLDRLKKTGEMQTKHRSGRPRFLDPEKEKQLLEYIDSHTKKNYHMVKIEKQLQCTRRTINNYALRNGIKAYRALKKPSLNDFQKKRRLIFCEEWLQRFDDCQKIIFTDEKLFNGQPTNTYQLVRRRKGERFLEENISHTIRPQPKTSTNIWVYIGPFGKGEIFLAENDEYFDDEGVKIKKAKHGTTSFFNAISYRNMLEKRAIPSIKERIDDFIFQQDNASIHCAKNESKTDTLVGELLKREGITTMYWPPLSPDLNPVENVHHLLQVELNKELTRLDIKPKNKADVFALCKECWKRVDNNTVKKIYFSFYSRLEKVKERNGANNY